MTANGYLQLALYVAVLLLAGWPLGLYMARVYRDELPGFVRWLRPVERGIYRISGVKAGDDMHWTRYAFAMLAFNLLGFLAVYGLQRLQVWLPLNPDGMANVTADSAFNTAVSFATNTNWQGYGGESTMSYLTQMLGLSGAELPLRRHRHGGAGGLDARLHPPGGQGRRQLLGGHGAFHALHPAAPVPDPGRGPGEPGRGADFRRRTRPRNWSRPSSTSSPRAAPTASR